jgi:uncharacterized repeat protein (TIGR03803 family)
VIFDKAGNLYGTTQYGGAYGRGVIFELSPVGTGWTETVLFNASGTNSPFYILIMDAAGNLYGGAGFGLFKLSPSGGGVWTEQLISTAVGPGCVGLAMDAVGNIFCTNNWTIVKLSPGGGGVWHSTVIHSFSAHPQEGKAPKGALVFDSAGNLYGSTLSGGPNGVGVVYKLSRGKTGKWTYTILYSPNAQIDGPNSSGTLVLDALGNIYGTTWGSGSSLFGTVFELVAQSGAGAYTHKVLWTFNHTDGADPYSLIRDNAGNLYGATHDGGANYYNGVLFELTP